MHRRGFAPIILLIVAAILAVGIGAYAWLGAKEAAKTPNVPVAQQQAAGSTNPAQASSTAENETSTQQASQPVSNQKLPGNTVRPRNRTINEIGDTVTINFRQCAPDNRTVYVGFGSTKIVIIGPQANNACLLKYGSEVENPNWNGQLPFTCSVPESLGLIGFSKSDYGVDFSSIQQYCTK